MSAQQRQRIKLEPLPGSEGRLIMQRLRPGLFLKYEDLNINLQQNLSMVFEPGIRMVFALNGETHIRIGRQEIQFSSDARFSAALFPVLESSLGYKKFKLQQDKRELVIFLSSSWIEECVEAEEIDQIRHILEDHLRPFYFTITPLIQQLLSRLCCDDYFQQKPLQQESLCLSLIHEVLQLIMPKKPLCANERLTQIADKIDVLLQLETAQPLSIKQIAHQCHSNPTSVQRIFKQRHGITLGAYRRRVQLEQGHKALQNGASVIQAAEIAGYQHLQSFSDAFRLEFGCLPKVVKSAAANRS